MKAIEAANFFIDLANSGDPEEGDGVSNMKLNKLLFFAQAISLQKYGKPLFDDPIEAWTHGPVIPDIYRTFKANCRNSIPHPYGSYNRAGMSEAELDVLIDTYREYARYYTASYLRNLTHQQDTPWSMTKPGAVIPVSVIKTWAERTQPSKEKKRRIPRSIVHTRRSAAGRLILPSEYQED